MANMKSTIGKALAAASLAVLAASTAGAQQVPADLTVMPPVPTDYEPAKTEWGDPDLRGMFPIDNIASLPMNRPANYGDRFWLTDEEYAQREAQAGRSTAAYQAEEESGTMATGLNPIHRVAAPHCWSARLMASFPNLRLGRRNFTQLAAPVGHRALCISGSMILTLGIAA